MHGNWLRIDEYRDVLASTNILALAGPHVRKEPTYWKWLILAAQNGVQGAIVCAIQDTTRTNILTKDSAAEMLNWLESLQGPQPEEKLAHFGTLLKKFRKQYPTILTHEQHDNIHKLHSEFRNKFAHFTPTHWSIEISMLPALMKSALDLIEDAMQQDQVAMHTSGNFKRQLGSNLAAARAAIFQIASHK